MSKIPIIKIGENLIISIQFDLDDVIIMNLQEDLTKELLKTKAKGVLIDITTLDLVDSFLCRKITEISNIASLLDANTILVGMSPAIAITIVEMGLTLMNVSTAIDIDSGLSLLEELKEKRISNGIEDDLFI